MTPTTAAVRTARRSGPRRIPARRPATPTTGGPIEEGRTMRIAQVAPPWIPVPPHRYGGIERVVAELTEHLVARGHDVTLFAAAGSRTSATLRVPLPATPDPATLGNSADDAAHALAAHLARDAFDVVHDHTGLVGAALAAMRRDGTPVVQTLHGAWTPTARLGYRVAARAVSLVAISSAQRRANREVPYAGTIHNGIDPAHFPLGRTPREDRLAFVGRASPEKSPADAIRIARCAGLPITLLVKRGEPAERTYWERVVAPLLGDDVTVVFDADDATKVAVLGRARALVFPIQWDEPFGMVMIEAMACGTPVVASRLGAAPEVVADGETGFLVDPADPVRSAVRALGRIDRLDPAACRARVVTHFSAARMAARYEALFRQVATRHRYRGVGELGSLASVGR
jgi:glycosyltransferase involved in cell wall biosynthesis